MLCAGNYCGCGIVSASLTVSGSGALGDPYHLETNAFSTVTSSTRPGSPFVGQWIWETDTGRELVWDGTAWRLIGGTQAPVCIVRTSSPVSIAANASSTVSFDTDAYDPFNWHNPASNPTRVTPNLPGWYDVSWNAVWEAGGGTYTRTLTGILVTGGLPNPWRRVDQGASEAASGNFTAAASAGWLQLNGTTDYVEMERFQSNGSSAARTLNAMMKVEWKARP